MGLLRTVEKKLCQQGQAFSLNERQVMQYIDISPVTKMSSKPLNQRVSGPEAAVADWQEQCP